MVEHFLREAGHDGATGAIVPEDTMTALRSYRWPGNVRELRNWVEATLAMGESPELHDELAPGSADSIQDRVLGLPYKDAREAVLGEFEKRYVSHLIERSDDNVTQAARLAKMDRSYLIKLLQKHGLR